MLRRPPLEAGAEKVVPEAAEQSRRTCPGSPWHDTKQIDSASGLTCMKCMTSVYAVFVSDSISGILRRRPGRPARRSCD